MLLFFVTYNSLIIFVLKNKFYTAIPDSNAWITNFCITSNPLLKATKKYNNDEKSNILSLIVKLSIRKYLIFELRLCEVQFFSKNLRNLYMEIRDECSLESKVCVYSWLHLSYWILSNVEFVFCKDKQRYNISKLFLEEAVCVFISTLLNYLKNSIKQFIPNVQTVFSSFPRGCCKIIK